jgi:hypothetical protein
MNTVVSTIDSLWKVVAIGVAFGAGLPIVFALGIRNLSIARVGSGGSVPPRGFTAVIGAMCITAVLAAVAVGILFIAKDFIYHTFDFSLFGADSKKG